MPINGKQKGKAGELEACEFLRGHGFEARRGVQYGGGGDAPDIVHDMDGFHIEVKRVENLNIYNAVEQAFRDKKPAEDAIVLHRRNKKPWLVTMTADQFMALLNKYVFER